MKKNLISLTARSAVIIGGITFFGHGIFEPSYMNFGVTLVIVCYIIKVAFVYKNYQMERYKGTLPVKLRYRCKAEAEDVARRLLVGVESGDIECHFCADYSQLSGHMVLRENVIKSTDVCQERYETNIVSLSKGGSILEINIPGEKRESLSENGMDLFLKDVIEAERI